jgi:acetate kinase
VVKRALILNAGSSTLKWSVLEAGGERPQGHAASPPWRCGGPQGHARRPIATGAVEWQGAAAPAQQAEQLQAVLRDAAAAGQVDAVGHRVVHGGATFRGPVRVTAEVRQALAALVEIDPLHVPAALAGIDAISATAPEMPQVAAFDTAFHATLSEAAAIYPLPWDWTERYSLRRYGFHGLSVSYATGRVAELLGGTPGRLLVCHLGSGCSLTAVAGGSSVDTSMGFTPLDGTMMATRSGAVDPGLLLYLLRRPGLGLDAVEDGLQHHAGLAGVSGAGGDLRNVEAAAAAGSRRAALAREIFVHSLVRTAGSMIAVLGGLDALVLTGGIGEHDASLRHDLLSRLAWAGVRLDEAPHEKGDAPNPATADPAAASHGDREISAGGSEVRVFVIEAREDLAVLAALLEVLQPAG